MREAEEAMFVNENEDLNSGALSYVCISGDV
jgi:hypothetical protein